MTDRRSDTSIERQPNAKRVLALPAVLGIAMLVIACSPNALLTDIQERVDNAHSGSQPTQAVAIPTFSPRGGTFHEDTAVTISCTTSGASIYYTITPGIYGTAPTTSSLKYSGQISVAGDGTTETIEAIAVADGMANSQVWAETYAINYHQVSTPQFNPFPSTYNVPQTVTISTSPVGAYIVYTTDGSTPSASGGALAPVSVTVSSSTTLKAIAYEIGLANSTVASASYVLKVATPTFSTSGGNFNIPQTVTISTSSPGAYISYTTDGSTPSASGGALAPVSVTVSSSETLTAIAYETGWANSDVASATYFLKVVNPTFSPGTGTYANSQNVTISTTTSGAWIRYTTDGSTPSETAGTLYTGAISVTVSETLKAIAYESGWTDSSVVTAAYSIPGSTWTARTLPLSRAWDSVAYGSGDFVVVSTNLSNAAALSAKGVVWEKSALPSGQNWRSVTWGNGLFVAVAEGNVIEHVVATSSDGGYSWKATILGGGQAWCSITYGNGLFVMVNSDNNAALTSPDGIAWTARTLPSGQWYSVTYGNGLFVAVANDGNKAATSSDGITWTARTLPGACSWDSVTYGNSTFVAVGGSAQSVNVAATSGDGITWTATTLPSSQYWSSVTYGNGVFLAVSNGSNAAATSPDGISWTARTLPSSASWQSVTYGNGVFVAVANGTAAATSP